MMAEPVLLIEKQDGSYSDEMNRIYGDYRGEHL